MSLSSKPLQPTVRVPSKPLKHAYEYFESVKTEFTKIQWTEGNEVWTYAKIVVASTFIFGLVIYLADLIIQRALGGLDMIFKWLAG